MLRLPPVRREKVAGEVFEGRRGSDNESCLEQQVLFSLIRNVNVNGIIQAETFGAVVWDEIRWRRFIVQLHKVTSRFQDGKCVHSSYLLI